MIFVLAFLSFAATFACTPDDQIILKQVDFSMMREDYWNANYLLGSLSDECQDARDTKTLRAQINYKLCKFDLLNFVTAMDFSSSLFMSFVKGPTDKVTFSYCAIAIDETKDIESKFGALTEKEIYIQTSAALGAAVYSLTTAVDSDHDQSIDKTFISACSVPPKGISDEDVDDVFRLTQEFYGTLQKHYTGDYALETLAKKLEDLDAVCGIACATSYPDAKDRRVKRALLQSEKYGVMTCTEADPLKCCL